MERYIYWKIECNSFKMDNSRYDLRYNIYSLGLDLDVIADVCFDLGKKLINQVYRKTCKKFYRKFSDYVWGFTMSTDDGNPWQEKVNEAIILAYQAAKHKFNKELGNIVRRGICDILGVVIINKVIQLMMENMGEFIKTLTNIIPEIFRDLINIENMVKKNTEEVLTSTFEGIIHDQSTAFVEVFNKSIENCET